MAEDPDEVEEKTFPDMDLAQKVFLLECGLDSPEVLEATKTEILSVVKQDAMAPYYEFLCARFSWNVDDALLAEMTAANTTELAELKETVSGHEQHDGETEVLDALFAIAKFFARIGDKSQAFAAYDTIIEKAKVSTGKKIDAGMHKLRVALFYLDTSAAKKFIDAVKKLAEDGGDWDRRNRIKVYESIFRLTERDFSTSAELLLGGLASFTCTEVCSYEKFVQYAVITNLLKLNRPDLKKKVVDGAEVLSVVQSLGPLPAMYEGLYHCDYQSFFRSLVPLYDLLLRDRYLSGHARFLIREFRILVYGQYLEAYKSVKLDTMAAAFGVSNSFLDSELSRFIATNRLSAKIDKVGGLVETNRPDAKNAQYHSMIKKGDVLLNQIQKLARVIDV